MTDFKVYESLYMAYSATSGTKREIMKHAKYETRNMRIIYTDKLSKMVPRSELLLLIPKE